MRMSPSITKWLLGLVALFFVAGAGFSVGMALADDSGDACGNGLCDYSLGENLENCPYDCKVCGDSICSVSEKAASCPVDCCTIPGGVGCGDGMCMGYSCGEDEATCPEDCGAVCGDNVCDKGEDPINCPLDCLSQYCGDGKCTAADGGQDKCPIDCAPLCGNCVCEILEDFLTCPIDCGYCGDGICSYCDGVDTKSCPECALN